jgi:DNA repair exonuclease SbcCD ATPase subunit
MIIKGISLRNFKSFGNNEQHLVLNTEKGELILLVGQNGNGKSSLIESIDYSLYGKVRGKRKKWVTQATLPNRINNELFTKIEFVSNGTEVEIQRGLNPNVLTLIENGIPNDKAGKSNLEDKIQKYVGVDIETFKSFISMSINDFKNFISLSTEEKQLLLDKLFNLEVINILNSILKDINKENKAQIVRLDSEIRTLEDSINSIKRSIETAIQKEKESKQVEIEQIKEDISSKKDEYQTLKDKIERIKVKEKELTDEIDKEKKEFITIQNEIKNVQKQLDLYELGKCPTCQSDLTDAIHSEFKDSLVEKKASLDAMRIELENNIKAIRERQNKLTGISNETNKVYNDMTYYLRNLKTKLEQLQKQQESINEDNSSDNTAEFKNTIVELTEKKTISQDNSYNCKDKELYYKELSKIFSEDGVKKSIISSIIKPINHFIAENIKQMGLPFEVILDDTFTATIKVLSSEVEHESLSTGETKKVNIAIMIAYLKLIRTKRHINILFLDEVFASIDVEGIYSILELLRAFANDYNINIFLVHHSILSQEYFDRIIRINKDIFSNIEEVQ